MRVRISIGEWKVFTLLAEHGPMYQTHIQKRMKVHYDKAMGFCNSLISKGAIHDVSMSKRHRKFSLRVGADCLEEERGVFYLNLSDIATESSEEDSMDYIAANEVAIVRALVNGDMLSQQQLLEATRLDFYLLKMAKEVGKDM